MMTYDDAVAFAGWLIVTIALLALIAACLAGCYEPRSPPIRGLSRTRRGKQSTDWYRNEKGRKIFWRTNDEIPY